MATACLGWVCSVVTIGSTGIYMAAMNDALLGGYAPRDNHPTPDDDKPIASRRKAGDGKPKRINTGGAKADEDDCVDSEYDKPLVTRLSDNAALRSGGNVCDDDSEDDTTLAARFSRATRSVSAGVSSSKRQQILPSNKGFNHEASASRNSFKRAGDGSSRTSSALKKAKPSDASASTTVSVKGEPEDDVTMTTYLWHEDVQCATRVLHPGRKISIKSGQPVDLTPEQEEVATMFAVMKDTEYASKEMFICNFFKDWRNILGRKHIFKKFELCDFSPIYEWHLQEKEKKKQMTSEEKKSVREEKSKQEEKFMWAFVDGVKEKSRAARLVQGTWRASKDGRLKRRIRPSDITINIGEGAPVPVCPVPGESWKEVKHDNTVTWLAFWNDPISPKDYKYVFLAASSSLKGQSDKEKYEKAQKLKDYIHTIRLNYTKDFGSKDQMKKQIAVATYLIDRLALRAGNEKDDDEADTVGCCTLKVENVTCLPPNNLQLNKETKDGTLLEKHTVYQRANKEAAIICNHQRAVPKSHDSQITKLNEKIDQLKAQRDKLKVEMKKAKKLKARKNTKDGKGKIKLSSQVYISQSQIHHIFVLA
ncbi:hypothetical protein ACQ4PT_069813 [Festuca glaucescens]